MRLMSFMAKGLAASAMPRDDGEGSVGASRKRCGTLEALRAGPLQIVLCGAAPARPSFSFLACEHAKSTRRSTIGRPRPGWQSICSVVGNARGTPDGRSVVCASKAAIAIQTVGLAAPGRRMRADHRTGLRRRLRPREYDGLRTKRRPDHDRCGRREFDVAGALGRLVCARDQPRARGRTNASARDSPHDLAI